MFQMISLKCMHKLNNLTNSIQANHFRWNNGDNVNTCNTVKIAETKVIVYFKINLLPFKTKI